MVISYKAQKSCSRLTEYGNPKSTILQRSPNFLTSLKHLQLNRQVSEQAQVLLSTYSFKTIFVITQSFTGIFYVDDVSYILEHFHDWNPKPDILQAYLKVLCHHNLIVKKKEGFTKIIF